MDNLGFSWSEEEEEEEGGLPIPPLDDAAFFPYSPSTTDLLHFFDEFDENGDLRDNQETPHGGRVEQKQQDRSGKNMQRLIEIQKEKESKGHSERSYNPTEDDHKKNNIQTCGVSTPLMIKGYEKGSWDGDEAAMKCKLERTKRKLQDSYQNIEKAKKQRRTQVIEFQPIPKQATYHKAGRPTSKKNSLHLRMLKV